MQELLNECKKAYEEKNFSRLEWACNRILEGDSNNETALTYKLYVYCDWHQHHLVFSIANQIHELYPSNYHAYNAEARAFLNKKEFEEALRSCEKGLEIEDYHRLRVNKIEALISLDRLDEAYEFCDSSEIPDYNFTKALINCGKYSKLSEYDEGLSKDELVDCLLKRCKYLNQRGNNNEILEACDEIFKIDKDNENALEYKVLALAFLDRPDEELQWSNYAIGLYPNNHSFYFIKGEVLYYHLKDIDGAIECFEKGLSLVDDVECFIARDELVFALNDKADQLIESGEYEDAINAYDRILFYNPKEFEALDNIDLLVRQHGIDYGYSKNYKKSLKLRIKIKNRADEIDRYLKTIIIGEYDDEYVNGCSEFKDYASIDDYVRDIIICLMEAYPGYDEERSKELLKCAMDNVKDSFKYKESAWDFAVVYGYSCG